MTTANFEIISDYDLRKTKYDIDTIEYNINWLSIKTIIFTQILTAEFCAVWILSGECLCTVEESYIGMDYILNRQPHLTREALEEARKKYGEES